MTTKSPDQDLIICRCERVTLGALVEARRVFDVSSGRELKLVTRASMGICQGRVCHAALEALYARWFPPGRDVARPRPPARPVPFGVLPSLKGDDADG